MSDTRVLRMPNSSARARASSNVRAVFAGPDCVKYTQDELISDMTLSSLKSYGTMQDTPSGSNNTR